MPVFGVILVRIQSELRENTNQNNFEYGHFLRSVGQPDIEFLSSYESVIMNWK